MRFFSKIAVLCNLSFLAYIVFWYIDMHNRSAGNINEVIPLPWLKGTLVILGFVSIIVNLLFLLLVFVFYALRSQVKIPRWIIIFSIIIFCCQVYFHFFLKDQL